MFDLLAHAKTMESRGQWLMKVWRMKWTSVKPSI